VNTNITFISASAGSGKTHRITEVIEDRLSKGLCRPGGLIATTYTVKAAQELRERVRQRLYNSGHPAFSRAFAREPDGDGPRSLRPIAGTLCI
jgi:ATP-dependent helicase/nuclease subunit A